MSDKGKHIASNDSFEFEGRTYLLAPLEIAELRELETFMRSRVVKEIYALGLEPADRQSMLEEVLNHGRVGTQEFAQSVLQDGNVQHLLWISMRKANPSVTKEEAEKLTAAMEGHEVVLVDLTFKLLAMLGVREDFLEQAKAALRKQTPTTPNPSLSIGN